MFNFLLKSSGVVFCYSKSFFRGICLTSIAHKLVPGNLKNTSSSSNEWVTRRINDKYTKFARYQNYRCRSAFKLIEIDDKYKILQPGQTVVDLGASPGSWTQVIVERLKLDKSDSMDLCPVIAVDLKHIHPIEGAIVLENSDFTLQETQDKIVSLLPKGKVDVVVSDMAPNATGIKAIDGQNISSLVYKALMFCTKVLNKNGTFVCKTWNSTYVPKTVEHMKLLFSFVKIVKPDSSYQDSSELFLFCKEYKGLNIPNVDKPQNL